MNFVILAGGGGTRLWPMSRNTQPKQLARLVTDLTLLEDTLQRFDGLATRDNLYISTNTQFAPMISALLPNFPLDHYIIEPEKRDTGPAMAYVATWLARIAPDEPMAFIASDHFIRDPEMYRETFRAAETMIQETGKLLDISITPTFPNVHLGYTHVGELYEHRNGIHFYTFKGHREKPDYETAKRFVDEGHYLWHANYYMWTPRKFVEAYKEFAPGIGDHLDNLLAAIESKDEQGLVEYYGKMEKISIDYAVAEKIDPNRVLIIRGDFGWGDMGSWDMLYQELAHTTDKEGNLIKADWYGIETINSLIYAPEGKTVATIGIDGLVVVDTPDALFVSSMGYAPRIKQIVELLKERGKHALL